MHIIKIILLTIVLLVSMSTNAQNYPTINSNGLTSKHKDFTKPIGSSKEGELTIMSFNIKDVRGISRTLNDFQILADMMDEADIVVIQELGAKGYRATTENIAKMTERFDAMIAVYLSYLGKDWGYVLAPIPTPSRLGGGAERPLVFYRKKSNDMSINVEWDKYHDLGDNKRDMGLFTIRCSKNGQSTRITVGTVHTSPNCKDGRGLQLTNVGKYAEENVNGSFVLLGDFNFGYSSNDSCHNEFPAYTGEDYLRKVHNDKKAFLVFNDFSYNGKGNANNFRTNLNKRASIHFYDQFLVSNNLAGLLADGGSLNQDCGWLSLSDNKYFENAMKKEARGQMKGFKKAMKYYGKSTSSADGKRLLKEQEKTITKHHTTVEIAAHHFSDHKPIWLQLRLF